MLTSTLSARSGFDSLRRIHEQDPTITSQLEIYVDGGARRGTDVLMALALGAKGVGMGRPFLHAQAAYGEKGAIRAVRGEYHYSSPRFNFIPPRTWHLALQTDTYTFAVLEQEIVTAMQLMGVSKLDELKPEMVECLREFWV